MYDLFREFNVFLSAITFVLAMTRVFQKIYSYRIDHLADKSGVQTNIKIDTEKLLLWVFVACMCAGGFFGTITHLNSHAAAGPFVPLLSIGYIIGAIAFYIAMLLRKVRNRS